MYMPICTNIINFCHSYNTLFIHIYVGKVFGDQSIRQNCAELFFSWHSITLRFDQKFDWLQMNAQSFVNGGFNGGSLTGELLSRAKSGSNFLSHISDFWFLRVKFSWRITWKNHREYSNHIFQSNLFSELCQRVFNLTLHDFSLGNLFYHAHYGCISEFFQSMHMINDLA